MWAAAKVALAAEFGGTWTEQDTLDCLGLSMKFTLDRLRERGVDLPDEQINERLVAKVREALAHQQVEFLPGIERFLTQVRDAQIPAAIVTNATTSIAQRTADAAPKGTFSVVIGNVRQRIQSRIRNRTFWRRSVWGLSLAGVWRLRIRPPGCAAQRRRA